MMTTAILLQSGVMELFHDWMSIFHARVFGGLIRIAEGLFEDI